MSRSGAVVAAVMLLAVTLVGCTSEPMLTPSPSASVSPSASGPLGDGVLRIGTLVPMAGSDRAHGIAQIAGVELAVREINEQGGVNGEPVVVFHRASGDATSDAEVDALAELIELNVDVVVGPSSAALLARALPRAAASGVALITPAVTAPVHATADDAGMLFRTIPSAATESFAIASHIGAGARVALAYYSDDDNRAARESLAIALADVGSELVVSERITPSMRSGAGLVAKLRNADPDVVVLSSPADRLEQNTAVLAALAETGLAGDSLWLSSQNLVNYGDTLPAGALDGARGILSGAQPDDAFIARLRTADPTVTDFRFAAEAYDAVILAALAAIAARDDAGVSIAAELRAVSSGGIACASFGECREVLTTAKKFHYDIDYVGVSGELDLDASGAPVSGNHRVFRYDSTNAPLPASE